MLVKNLFNFNSIEIIETTPVVGERTGKNLYNNPPIAHCHTKKIYLFFSLLVEFDVVGRFFV